jgi:hypothetical protein
MQTHSQTWLPVPVPTPVLHLIAGILVERRQKVLSAESVADGDLEE